MSGLAVVLGEGASTVAVERMLAAAPHRGESVRCKGGPGWAAGVQGREGEDPFVSCGLHGGDGVAVALAGCLHRDDCVLSGDGAAAEAARAYLAGGPAGLAGLEGSFAAVAVEAAGPRAVAVRSAVGERPLFWRGDRVAVALASEVKQVLAAPLPRPPFDHEALIAAVAGRPPAIERTSYRGVRRLAPGSHIEVEPGGHREGCFWDPRTPGRLRVSLGEAVEEFRRLLHLAVARRLGPGTGLLLSGGLDSGAIAAEAAPLHLERHGSPLRVVSAAYPDHPRVDEARYVRATVARLGCEAIWLHPRPRPFDALDREARLHDGPDIAPLSSNLRQILAGAWEAGVRRLMDGHDGDTVLGSPAGAAGALLRRGRVLVLGRHLGFMRARHGLGRAETLRRYLAPAVIDLAPALGRLHRDVDAGLPIWATGDLRARLVAGGGGSWEEEQAGAVAGPLVLALEHLERIALSEGVSLTHPFADPELVAFLLDLPPEVAFATGATKSLVRLAYPELPAEVAGRAGKTRFDDVALAGASPAKILDEVRRAPRVFPGVDWDALERRLGGGEVGLPERALLGRVLSADLFLGSDLLVGAR